MTIPREPDDGSFPALVAARRRTRPYATDAADRSERRHELHSQDRDARSRAIDALAGDPASVDDLIDAALDDRSPLDEQQRTEAIAAAAAFAAPDQLARLDTALNDETSATRRHAWLQARAVAGDSALVELCSRLLATDPSSAVRELALAVLAELDDSACPIGLAGLSWRHAFRVMYRYLAFGPSGAGASLPHVPPELATRRMDAEEAALALRAWSTALGRWHRATLRMRARAVHGATLGSGRRRVDASARLLVPKGYVTGDSTRPMRVDLHVAHALKLKGNVVTGVVLVLAPENGRQAASHRGLEGGYVWAHLKGEPTQPIVAYGQITRDPDSGELTAHWNNVLPHDFVPQQLRGKRSRTTAIPIDSLDIYVQHPLWRAGERVAAESIA